MLEWDPEHFTSFEHLCEVTLATIREKTEADRIYLWLSRPQRELFAFDPEHGLVAMVPDHAGRLGLPISFIEQALAKGQLLIELMSDAGGWQESVEAPPTQLRACFPLKRQQGLEGGVYLETRRRLDRLTPRQKQGIQLLMHYLAAELESRMLSNLVTQERSERLTTQDSLARSQALQQSFLDLLQSLHQVGVHLSGCRGESELLHDAVMLARSSLQFDRVAIFLIDAEFTTMQGSWGTNEAGEITDERHFVSPIPAHPVVQEALRRKDYVLVLEDAPLYYEQQEVGRGWNAMVSLWDGDTPIGWIAADNLLQRRPIKTYHGEIFKQFAAMLSQLLIRQRNHAALELFNRDLEERVAARTRLLAETNEALAQANQALEQANQQLALLSMEDPLTRIANRRQWDLTLAREWEVARRQQGLLAVLMIDVDEFKAYNDHFGHSKGDLCLRQVAQLLQECERRRTNLVARYGGEEFVILLCNPQPGEAEFLCQRIHHQLARLAIPHPASRVKTHLTVSIGFSYRAPDQEMQWEQLIEQADQGLYLAKSAGRACSRGFDPHALPTEHISTA